jgi:RNA polymerase sigma-70 factor, ECF subfamily
MAMRGPDFERLYAQHAADLLAFLVYRMGDRALAEDVLADTFERVLTTKTRFDRRKASEKTWLYSIALNLIRDNARRSAASHRALERVVAGDTDGHASDGFDAVDQRDALSRGLSSLSDEERESIALRFGADLTVPEIARLLGEKLSTVEGRVYRGLRKLRAELE